MTKTKHCKVYTLECQQGDEICFRYNKIRYFDSLERQTMGVNKYASTFPMASHKKVRKCAITEKKCGVKKKNENTRKYAIEDNQVV